MFPNLQFDYSSYIPSGNNVEYLTIKNREVFLKCMANHINKLKEVICSLMNIKPNKVHIIGSVGSGKSTLARSLSTVLDIPYYELDNVVWKSTENGDVRNSVEDRDAILNNIITSDKWIIEGVHYKWVLQGFEKAEIIIYLDTGICKRNYRILKRFIVQKLGFEKGNYEQTLEMLRKMYRWSYNHKKNEKPEILNILEQYNNKLLVLHDNTDIQKHIKMV